MHDLHRLLNSLPRGDRLPQDNTLDSLYFEGLGKRKVFFKNGVHQGSPVSPALFNIYIEDMIARVSRELEDQNIWYMLYADDLVLIMKQRDIQLLKGRRALEMEALRANTAVDTLFGC